MAEESSMNPNDGWDGVKKQTNNQSCLASMTGCSFIIITIVKNKTIFASADSNVVHQQRCAFFNSLYFTNEKMYAPTVATIIPIRGII